MKKTVVKLILFLYVSILVYANYCEQIITVNFIPETGVKIYGITGGDNDKRGIVDLGHFNGIETEKKLKIGSIEVKIEMTNKESSSSNNDIEIVEINKLKNFVWNYTYDITPFIKNNDGTTAKILVENMKVLNEAEITDGVIIFTCYGEEGEHSHEKLEYTFDMILELKNINPGGMYGISSEKKSGTKAYINLKDIILDQLKGSGLTK